MSLFNAFSKKQPASNGFGHHDAVKPPEIPEHLFIEKEKPAESGPEDTRVQPANEKGIDLLFSFLDRNHEAKGYDDALMNPDSSHLQQNLNALRKELERTILKVKTFYEDFIKEIDFHIQSRKRSGLVDTVDELMMKKDIAVSHMEKVSKIEEDVHNGTGDGEGIMMSYTRGFKNGLAAISHHTILKRKF